MKAAALALLLGLFAALGGGAQSPAARIELRDERPYAFNRGRIAGPAGLGPRLELYGTTMSGERRLLFVSEEAAGLGIDFAVYNDGTLLELELVGQDAQGRPLSARHKLSLQPIPEEERSLLRRLRFSYGAFPGLEAPGPEGLERGDAEYLSRQINASYFSARPSYLPALALAGWALSALLLAAPLARKGAYSGAAADAKANAAAAVPATTPASAATPATSAAARFKTKLGLGLALSLVLSAALSLVLLAALGPRPRFFVFEGALAGGRVEEVGLRRLEGYEELRWRAPDGLGAGAQEKGGAEGPSPAADYLGLRSPRGAALPLSAFDAYRYILFSERPLVVREPGGALRIGGGPFLSAWGIRR